MWLYIYIYIYQQILLFFVSHKTYIYIYIYIWRLSQPGFDPSYGKLVCLATLMSSDRTKQICLWMNIYIYIYIYIPANPFIYLFFFFFAFNFVVLHVCEKPNNFYYSSLCSFSTFMNTYFIALGQMLAATISLTLFHIRVILV